MQFCSEACRRHRSEIRRKTAQSSPKKNENGSVCVPYRGYRRYNILPRIKLTGGEKKVQFGLARGSEYSYLSRTENF